VNELERSSTQLRGAVSGLLAAASFGVSAPFAKLLLGSLSPVLLAGLLYLGGAAGLWLQRAVRPRSAEAGLQRSDLPALGGIVLLGGVLGPLFMLLGLARVSAFTGSLLLNLEAPLTVIIAVVLFNEHLGRSAAAAAGCIFIGAALLKLEGGGLAGDGLGTLLLAAACACWALDNNLTQRLALRDPFAIGRVKTLIAGLVNTNLGMIMLGGELPKPANVLGALALGSVSYGASVVLDAYALRWVGAVREAAYFATAPFVGALVSVWLFGAQLGLLDQVALLAMIAGVVLLVRERHSHAHVHETLEHEHLHTHDEHHQHAHAPGHPAGEPHAHPHRHERLQHTHAHAPDAHHRHEHDES
jgi:drug/metabolite transporter (DMT)-like permease